MHKLRVFTYILLILGLSFSPALAAEEEEKGPKELDSRNASAIIRKDDRFHGKVTHLEEPLLPRSIIVPSTLRTPIDTRTSQVGDVISVQTQQDLFLGEDNIIPMGSYMRGRISKLQKPGRFFKKAEIEVDFSSVYIAGKREEIHVLGKLKEKQLRAKAEYVNDGMPFKTKAKMAGAGGAVVGATGGYALTELASPWPTWGIEGLLNNITILAMAGAGAAAGVSMVTRDDARIETGTPLDIILKEASHI